MAIQKEQHDIFDGTFCYITGTGESLQAKTVLPGLFHALEDDTVFGFEYTLNIGDTKYIELASEDWNVTYYA